MIDVYWDTTRATMRLNGLLLTWRDLSPIKPRIDHLVHTAVWKNYQTEGNGSWPPRTRIYSWPPLRKTQRMMAAQLSAIPKSEYTHHLSGHTFDYSNVIQATEYSRFHHTGTKNMPKRRTVELDKDTQTQITKSVGHYMIVEHR